MRSHHGSHRHLLLPSHAQVIVRLHRERMHCLDVHVPALPNRSGVVLDRDPGFRRRQRDGSPGRPLGSLEIHFRQCRRKRKRVAYIVKTVGVRVGREIRRRIEIYGQKVANGVGVLIAVQPANGDGSRVWLGVSIRRLILLFQPLADCGQLLSRRPGDSRGRHFSRLQFKDDFFPDFPIFESFGTRLLEKPAQIQAARHGSRVVAGAAGLLDDWFHDGLETIALRACAVDRRKGKNSAAYT